MAKNQNKTQPTVSSVHQFIENIDNDQRRADCFELLKMMEDSVGCPPKMWGKTMVGFGTYHYKYKSGREGDFFLSGFSPRKAALTIYIMAGFDAYPNIMEKLGRYKTGQSCLYVKKLDDIDRSALKDLMVKSVEYMRKTYPD